MSEATFPGFALLFVGSMGAIGPLITGRVLTNWPFKHWYRDEQPKLFWGHVTFFAIVAVVGASMLIADR